MFALLISVFSCHLAQNNQDPMASHDFSTLTILVIDDNPHMRKILKTILRGFGVRHIVEVSDAVSGLEELSMTAIDIVLVDWMIGDIDGHEFTSMVRRNDDCTNVRVPIIMISAHSERSNIERARSAGIDEYLCKPVRPIDLLSRIISVIDNPRPFVKAAQSFIGPDRRRKTMKNLEFGERRKNTAQTKNQTLV